MDPHKPLEKVPVDSLLDGDASATSDANPADQARTAALSVRRVVLAALTPRGIAVRDAPTGAFSLPSICLAA